MGLEPTLSTEKRILSPLRLPVPPHWHVVLLILVESRRPDLNR